ncbi:MAG: hypothetical protein RLZZ604_117 [Pseudomonadota bacterium]
MFEKGWALAQQVAVHSEADIGNRALPEPGHIVKAKRSGSGHNGYDYQKIFEPAGNIRRVTTGGKSAIDDQAEPCGNGKCGKRSDGERQQSKHNLLRIGRGMLPNHTQIAEFFGIRWLGGLGRFG